MILALSISAFAAGCASVGNFCDVSSAYPATEGTNYSAGEQGWIVSHNEYGEQACGWRP